MSDEDKTKLTEDAKGAPGKDIKGNAELSSDAKSFFTSEVFLKDKAFVPAQTPGVVQPFLIPKPTAYNRPQGSIMLPLVDTKPSVAFALMVAAAAKKVSGAGKRPAVSKTPGAVTPPKADEISVTPSSEVDKPKAVPPVAANSPVVKKKPPAPAKKKVVKFPKDSYEYEVKESKISILVKVLFVFALIYGIYAVSTGATKGGKIVCRPGLRTSLIGWGTCREE